MKYFKNHFFIFLIKLNFILLPIYFFAILIFIIDPLRIFYVHENYYKNSYVNTNREFISFKLYEKNSKKYDYNSFIFGSSRSLAYKVDKYIKKLPENSVGFHFSGNGAGIFNIYNQMKYIDKTGGSIDNALIILDGFMLTKTFDFNDHLMTSPYQLTNKSRFKFYKQMMSPLFNVWFNISYIDYYFFKTKRKYMDEYLSIAENITTGNNFNNDIYLGSEKINFRGEENWRNFLVKGKFYNVDEMKKNALLGRVYDNNISRLKYTITQDEIEILLKIKELIDKHNTNFHIVISPLYDQIELDINQLSLLKNIFGERVYNFSGVNKFTQSIYNYYDSSHYRTEVGNEIIDIIFDNK